jgi:hypothetical protein
MASRSIEKGLLYGKEGEEREMKKERELFRTEDVGILRSS